MGGGSFKGSPLVPGRGLEEVRSAKLSSEMAAASAAGAAADAGVDWPGMGGGSAGAAEGFAIAALSSVLVALDDACAEVDDCAEPSPSPLGRDSIWALLDLWS